MALPLRSRGEVSNVDGDGHGVPARIMRMGDDRIDPRRDDLLDVRQPLRSLMSMDSYNDNHLYLALQKVLRQHHSATLREQRKGASNTLSIANG